MSVTTLLKGNSVTTVDQGASTLQRLRALEHLYEQGYQDDVVDLTVQKLLDHQLQQDETQLDQLRSDLTKFERQFGMTSELFANQYQDGQTGDEIDFFEWYALYKMYTRLRKQLELLKEHLGE